MKIAHPKDSFTPVDFCPVRDEIIVWDQDFSHVFSKSTHNDTSFYNFHLDEYGFKTVKGVSCARISGAVGVWATDATGQLWVATIYGNQFNDAKNRIHSVVQWGTSEVPTFAHSFTLTSSGIGHVSIGSAGLKVKYAILAGPYVMADLASTFATSETIFTLNSGNETRTLTKQLNIQSVVTSVKLGQRKKNITLAQGTFNIEDSVDIIGPVTSVSLSGVPASLQDKLVLQNRYAKVSTAESERVTNGARILYALGHNADCTAYLVKDSDTGLLSVSVRGAVTQCNINIPLNVAHVAAVYARVEASQAVVAFVTRIGSQPIINV